jgi:integrase
MLPFFGTKRLDDITPLLIEKYKQKRSGEVKPGSVNRELILLKYMLNLAVSWGKLGATPMKGVRMLRVDNFPERILSRQEEEVLLKASCDHLKPVILTALHTGMRLTEILTLKWDQVDLDQRVITILFSKNGRIRKIPINAVLMAIFKGLREKSTTPFVFVVGEAKCPVSSMRTAWLAALRRSGIAHCRFHDLRHTFASRLVAAGVDLVTVKELLGHSTITMTIRYSHSAPESKQKAVAMLENGIFDKDGHFMDTKAISDKLAKYVSLLP